MSANEIPYLRIRNWDKYQSYRKDRGQPPWIKVHRDLMRNIYWVCMSDADRGQLVAIWMLAADEDGQIPANPKLVRKLCCMESDPDLQAFIDQGFIERDVTMTSRRRQDDAPEAEAEAEVEAEAEAEADAETTTDLDDLSTLEAEKARARPQQGAPPTEDRPPLPEPEGPDGIPPEDVDAERSVALQTLEAVAMADKDRASIETEILEAETAEQVLDAVDRIGECAVEGLVLVPGPLQSEAQRQLGRLLGEGVESRFVGAGLGPPEEAEEGGRR